MIRALAGLVRVLVAAALALLVAPRVAAHGDEPAATFDPLHVDWPLHLAPRGATRETPPPEGTASFPPSDPPEPAKPLAFAYVSPVKHQLGLGLDVLLKIQAYSAPVVASGDALELSLALEGLTIKDSTKRVAFSKSALAPGDVETLRAVLPAPGVTFAKGANVSLVVTPLVPVLFEGGLRVLLGENASRATLESMRVPTVADLELQDAPLAQFDARSESFQPADPDAVVALVVVRHDGINVTAPQAPAGAPLYAVVRGDEPAADAEDAHAFADRARRIDASHELRVGGTLVRVIPNVGVAVPLGANGPASVACARNCPAGFQAPLRHAAPDDPPSAPTVYRDDRSTLVPPPADTSGVKRSPDAPTKKSVDAAPWAAALAAAALLQGARRARPPRR